MAGSLTYDCGCYIAVRGDGQIAAITPCARHQDVNDGVRTLQQQQQAIIERWANGT